MDACMHECIMFTCKDSHPCQIKIHIWGPGPNAFSSKLCVCMGKLVHWEDGVGLRAMPHDRHEEVNESCAWMKATPNYHTRGCLREGYIMCQGIFVKQTTMRGALETRELWKK